MFIRIKDLVIKVELINQLQLRKKRIEINNLWRVVDFESEKEAEKEFEKVSSILGRVKQSER